MGEGGREKKKNRIATARVSCFTFTQICFHVYNKLHYTVSTVANELTFFESSGLSKRKDTGH